MRVVLRAGYEPRQLLSPPAPDTSTVYIVPSGQQDVSRGDGTYLPDRLYAVYRDPTRPFDALCVIATPVGSGEPRCIRVTMVPREGEELKGDLRIPLDSIVKSAADASGTGSGPVLPAGSVHPTGAVYTPRLDGSSARRRRVYHTLDERRLAEVAWVVGRAAREGRSTRGAVAETWGIAEATAAEWIGRAREAGMLPEVDGKRNPSVDDNQPTQLAEGTLGGEEEQ